MTSRDPAQQKTTRLPVEVPPHSFEIGFMLGPPGRIAPLEKHGVLEQIHGHGFVHLRAYEVFGVPRPPVPQPADVMSWFVDDPGSHYAQTIELFGIAAGRGFQCLVGCSNFPYSRAEILGRTIPPYGAGDEEFRKRLWQTLQRTNRFPPRDLERYGEQLGEFVAALRDRVGAETLRTWAFEIGNEPDSPQYFWGAPEYFRAIATRAEKVIHDIDPALNVGAAGYTSSLATENGRPVYRELAGELAANRAFDFASFHVYNVIDALDERIALTHEMVARSPRRIMSEWNASTQWGPYVELLYQPGYMYHLLRLALLATRLDIARVYVHKLADTDKAALGIFDQELNAKPAYKLIRYVKGIVETAYRVVEVGPWMVIFNLQRAIIARSPHGPEPPVQLDVHGAEVLDASCQVVAGKAEVRPGDWLMLACLDPGFSAFIERLAP